MSLAELKAVGQKKRNRCERDRYEDRLPASKGDIIFLSLVIFSFFCGFGIFVASDSSSSAYYSTLVERIGFGLLLGGSMLGVTILAFGIIIGVAITIRFIRNLGGEG